MLDWLFKTKYALGLLFIFLLVIFELVRLKNMKYYEDINKNSQMAKHVLNTRFRLHESKNLDYKKINIIMFIVSIIPIICGGLLMMWNLIVGLIVYVVLSTLLVYQGNIYIVKKFK